MLIGITAPVKAQLTVDVDNSAGDELVISVPGLPTPQSVNTPAGSTAELGGKISDVIVSDLRSSGLFKPKGRNEVRGISFDEVTAPQFPYWAGTNSSALIQGFIRANPDGKLTVGCYLYDVALETELTRQGFVVDPGDWRRAAHKCADSIYSRLSGESPFFDSRIAYIAETGPKGNRTKRLAIMDSDGANHRFITNGQATALTPRFSPDYRRLVYLSFLDGNPRIYVYEIGTGQQKLITQSTNPTFAPRWSPDGKWILYSMAISGNTDIYKVSSGGGTPQRLTFSPGIDIGGSFSPDGSRIVFESDRSGSQQLYVMGANGGNENRISFGGGRYATPEWSPRGDLISFTKMAGNFRIGVMTPSGGGERLLTNSWQDEAPTWAPNGRVIQFFRTARGSGQTGIWQVDLTGRNERKLPTPVDGSDPAWGPLLP
ncbi:Tol-Pal system beta propeller repeat protein TolB [Parasphingorhabdus halotolerans]|uniref:Tol-Pal system protein TolB n=1 Tax=Parasphingorhabdus halotolerans TaxID=2725558 RepID=A0A6H2DRI2_9SPHN|nr:Tol-Pal system beta propeller repeat protein TolB [Parasphingorhabdus halotolerans]QJB70737.1 Tol-Pal system protein TolB [Parasphingorhabdus halotolerans]